MVSVTKKRAISRLIGYPQEALARRLRVLAKREQTLVIGDRTLTLPPEHRLPYFQQRDPTYDAYAVSILARIADESDEVCVFDLGANVGDTAAAALSAAPHVRVVAVEGDAYFASYLTRNLGGDPRVDIVEGFVGPLGTHTTFARDGSTGGFGVAAEDSVTVAEWVSVESLLQRARPDERVVWKSDIDGFDIPLLATHWAAIDARCHAIWCEFDPVGTLGDPASTTQLIELLAGSGRTVEIYDNLGRKMLSASTQEGITETLTGLTQWLSEQRSGHMTVQYLDLWATRR